MGGQQNPHSVSEHRLESQRSLQSLRRFVEREITLDAIRFSRGSGWSSSVYSSHPSVMDERPVIVFTRLAKAIAAYEGAPGPDRELSFERNDVVEVSLATEGWWVARKANGETGIVPSNFFELLPEHESARSSPAYQTDSTATRKSLRQVISACEMNIVMLTRKARAMLTGAKGRCVRLCGYLDCKSQEDMQPYAGT